MWIQCSSACVRAPSTYQPQGIAITTSGLRPESFAPGDLGGLQPRRAGDVLASRDRDHLRNPVPPHVGRVEPLQRDHARQGRPRDGGADRRQPALQFPSQLVRLVLHPGCLAKPDHVLEHLAQRARVLLDDPGLARQARGDLEHVLEGDRAHGADRLGDDQVGGQLLQQILVELVQRLSLGNPRLHLPVDLGGAEVGPQHGSRQVGERTCLGWVVALMGDRDEAVAEPQGIEHLGRGRDEACDAHQQVNMAFRDPSRWIRGLEGYICVRRMADDELPRSTGPYRR